MPSISKIRLTNVVYEEGNKRYNDELFLFDGQNGAILLENGGGKTVLIQTALQAIIPHTNLAERKIKSTLQLENAPAHIAIEWMINDAPKRYVVTAVTLFITKNGLDSLRYVYEYEVNDPNGIEGLPFVRDGQAGKRPAERGEMQDYYSQMRESSFRARGFQTIKDYRSFLEEQYHIIANEWDSIVKINSSEGGVEAFFDDCKSTTQLFDRLLIPTVENSIAGHEETMFADMFEKQYVNFKQYKKFKETIEENKRIQAELETYVQIFEAYHQSKLSYEKEKQRAKGTWEEIQLQQHKAMKEQAAIGAKLTNWKERSHQYSLKTSSYHIAVEETIFRTRTRDSDNALAQYSKRQEELEETQIDYYSLQLAQLKKEQKDFQDQLKVIEVELEKLHETEELGEIENQLEEAQRKLLGFFLTELAQLEKEIQGVSYELNPITEQLQQMKDRLTKLRAEETDKQQNLASIQGQLETRKKDMEKLEQQLLANPKQEKVQEEMVHWQKRNQFLDEEIIRLQQEKKQFQLELRDAEETKEELVKEQNNVDQELKMSRYDLRRLEEAQKTLIHTLASLRPQWAVLDNVYDNESSISSRLESMKDKLERERQQLFYQERVAHRFVDDYQQQDIFFGDAFIESQLKVWKNQFDYLTTGIEYLLSLEVAEYEKRKDYPLWPLTLITTNKSKSAVQEKVNDVKDKLQFPIHVLTTEEAMMIHQGEIEAAWIGPLHWTKGADTAAFLEWKSEILQKANEATKLREEKETEIKVCESVQQAFQQFLEQYPYEEKQRLSEKRSTLAAQLEQLTLSMNKEEKRIEEIHMSLMQMEETTKNDQNEKQGIEGKIDKGGQYLQYHREVEIARQNEQQINEQLNNLEKEIKTVQLQYDAFSDEKGKLEGRKNSLESEMKIRKGDEDFLGVRSLRPIYSDESKKSLQEQIRNLEDKIRKINVSYGEWKVKKEHANSNIERIEKSIEQLHKQHCSLDENRLFPSDGEELLNDLWQKIEKTKKEMTVLDEKVKKKFAAKEKQEGKLGSLMEQFQKDYPQGTIIQFNVTLTEVKEELNQEAIELTEAKAFLEQENKRIEQDLSTIEKAERQLERFIEKHHFNAPDIAVISLSSEEVLNFSYNRKPFVDAIVKELEAANELVEVENKKIEKAKQSFRQFCQTLTDVKLKQMAEKGIEYKRTYEDLLTFKKNMLTSIERGTNYANEHIRSKDEELQAFINQIHAHLKTLVEELKQIPKMTKIKVEDQWKQIFNFTIPDWEEEEGKSRIRDYIEWILTQLEFDRFLNDQGQQDDAKIRKELDMWLQSKQLVQMILKNEVMKVNCRKVTNDNKVTTRSYSWEQSNVWSGGEKWSKNMTLFLGILNYVAEKKQHIQSNMKRHRSVILDNPFGKASSDHVLTPVFYIAEQLGFQIIALTAHAEGKFLQDFFPVIYSCRLREAVDSNKKVMTTEKRLHHAYFQDHEPQSIERLGETEQLKWFE
ncbi:hypothetical protein CD798_06220 [Bacillaceae bacterium SAOS 7]|nr:hypothetical protein CD798_06220 [Bacillaceae bacterium SAOS 7]